MLFCRPRGMNDEPAVLEVGPSQLMTASYHTVDRSNRFLLNFVGKLNSRLVIPTRRHSTQVLLECIHIGIRSIPVPADETCKESMVRCRELPCL